MRPVFEPSGNLPPGIHQATWKEVEERFGWNPVREHLLTGLRLGLVALHHAKCGLVLLDGSFVTAREHPRDFDACYETAGMVPGRLDPVFMRFENGRAAQKLKFGGEFFPLHFSADGFRPFIEFFQTDKETGLAKGIVAIDPGSAL